MKSIEEKQLERAINLKNELANAKEIWMKSLPEIKHDWGVNNNHLPSFKDIGAKVELLINHIDSNSSLRDRVKNIKSASSVYSEEHVENIVSPLEVVLDIIIDHLQALSK